jgi:hypothetical protein
MTGRKKSISKSRKLSAHEAKRVARNLQRATGVLVTMGPLSLRSTATGKGTVVFRASRVLSSLVGAAKN